MLTGMWVFKSNKCKACLYFPHRYVDKHSQLILNDHDCGKPLAYHNFILSVLTLVANLNLMSYHKNILQTLKAINVIVNLVLINMRVMLREETITNT